MIHQQIQYSISYYKYSTTASSGVVDGSDNVAYGHVNTASNTGGRQTDTAVYEAV